MSSPQPVVLIAGCAFTINLFRFSIDLIAEANSKDEKLKKPNSNTHHHHHHGKTSSSSNNSQDSEKKKSDVYGSVAKNGSGGASVASGNVTAMTETTSLISSYNNGDPDTESPDPNADEMSSQRNNIIQTLQNLIPNTSLFLHCVFLVLFVKLTFLEKTVPLGNAVYTLLIGIILHLRDRKRKRFGAINRFLYVLSTLTLLLAGIWSRSIVSIVTLCVFVAFSILEVQISPFPTKKVDTGKKATLSREAIWILLKPYCWPDATNNSAALNRVLAILTWLCVIASKACNLISPVFLGKASTALTRFQYGASIRYTIYYAILSFLAKLFKEGQSLLYLKVAQAAFVQLSEAAFHHIHCLSLDWHLRKKLGDGEFLYLMYELIA